MIEIIRTDSSHVDFKALVKLLDADLKMRDGEDHVFYAQFNKIDAIKNVVVGYKGHKPVACGAFKPFAGNAVERKKNVRPA